MCIAIASPLGLYGNTGTTMRYQGGAKCKTLQRASQRDQGFEEQACHRDQGFAKRVDRVGTSACSSPKSFDIIQPEASE